MKPDTCVCDRGEPKTTTTESNAGQRIREQRGRGEVGAVEAAGHCQSDYQSVSQSGHWGV